MPNVVAVACSDIHFSHSAPVARSAEPDWYAAQERAWRQVEDLASEHKVDIIIAGDIFDKWHANKTPQLINWTIAQFQCSRMIRAIPGQHDLPDHRLDQRHHAAYGTLMAADVIDDLT